MSSSTASNFVIAKILSFDSVKRLKGCILNKRKVKQTNLTFKLLFITIISSPHCSSIKGQIAKFRSVKFYIGVPKYWCLHVLTIRRIMLRNKSIGVVIMGWWSGIEVSPTLVCAGETLYQSVLSFKKGVFIRFFVRKGGKC